MSNFMHHKAVKELADLTYTMWQMGWDEKNGGNISYLLSQREIEEIEIEEQGRFYEMVNVPENLVGKYLVITASGSNFRLVKEEIERTIGVIRVEKAGYTIVAGFAHNNQPTSEIYMHLLSHGARLQVDPEHRVIVHNHATEISAMTFIHELDDRAFTRTLWSMITECIVVFPDGIGVLPWMVCGNEEIGLATAKKMASCRIVVWAHHGVLASGKSLNDAFGLIETVNKAAKIYLETYDKRITTGITDEQLVELCQFFHITPKEGILNTSFSTR